MPNANEAYSTGLAKYKVIQGTSQTMLKLHLTPQSSVIAEQHKFALRTQHEGETIANYVAELRKMIINQIIANSSVNIAKDP